MSNYVITKWKGKKRKDKKSNKGASTENSGRNGKILFFHSSRGRRWRDEVRAVFSEKIHHPPYCHPRPRHVDLYFFHPCPPLPTHRRYILLPMANAGLANFETKTLAESKTKLVLCLFAIAKQGRCKTTIKTLVWGWKITFHQSHRYFSVCYIASWNLITESEPKSMLIIRYWMYHPRSNDYNCFKLKILRFIPLK